MLTSKEIAMLLMPKAVGNRVSIAEAEQILEATENFVLEEYGCDSIAELISELGGEMQIEEDCILVTLAEEVPLASKEEISVQSETNTTDDDKNKSEEEAIKEDAVIVDNNEPDGEKISKPKEKPIGPPEDFDIAVFNKRIAKLIASSGASSVPLTFIGQTLREKSIELPAKLSVCLSWSPDIFVMEMPKEGSYAIGLTSKGKELIAKPKKVAAPVKAAPAPAPVKAAPAPAPAAVSMSRYHIASFCVISPINDFLAQLAMIAAPDGWFIIDDPAEKQPYRLLLRKFELDFAIAMRDELEGRETPFSTGMSKAIYRTNFHDADNNPIYMEMEFNSQRDTSTLAPWKFKRFYVEKR